jgi:hypothetical protein
MKLPKQIRINIHMNISIITIDQTHLMCFSIFDSGFSAKVQTEIVDRIRNMTLRATQKIEIEVHLVKKQKASSKSK